jgi:hypothetical protein
VSAIISPCGKFRLRLEREIDVTGPVVAIAGVNPSTADAIENDQTIRKDIGFGRVNGWSRIIKINKFAFRATDVRALERAADPIGPGNDEAIVAAIKDADIVLFAWGPLAKLPKRLRTRWRFLWEAANDAGKQPVCLGTARDGHPRHTLMLPYSTQIQPWKPVL